MIECINYRDQKREELLNKISTLMFNRTYENLLYWQQAKVLDVYKTTKAYYIPNGI